MAKDSPIISVVIPSYNEATYIDRLLEDLARQNYKDFEVIVSDAQSKDGTKKVVESFAKKLNVLLVESPPKGPGAGRNRGAEAARGDWLLFLDADDDIDDPNFLSTLLEKTLERGWNTSSARMTVNNKWHFRLGIWIFYHHQKRLAHTSKPVAQGYCILTNRKIFEKHRGFNEKIRLGEDNDYVTRVGKHGFGFVDETYYYVDLRRNKSGGIGYAYKAIANEIYRMRGGDLEKNRYAYEFGKHKKRGD
jgi:glycosyltransferase involved in cell wall biosynthesis